MSRAKDSGSAIFIRKPFETAEIASHIRHALAVRRKRGQILKPEPSMRDRTVF